MYYFFQPNIEFSSYIGIWSNLTSKVLKNGQHKHDGELFGIASADVELSRKQTISQKVRGTFQKKPLSCLWKFYRLFICINCHSSFPVVWRSGIWQENSRALTMRVWLFLWGHSSLLTVQVCVVPLNISYVFCICSLTYTAIPSWSIWTTDHSNFHIS